ncbi:uncharacterized protein LOC113344866 [Papaver somniferum]|uniref:uncharacterized protein LOC113344866 n=1 Tax=Papaver somniferum TaxID=3469 RepID=UPI000E6FBA30|nr:uncharacterized protein LOC113344866 [Papaver somniferum]
MSIKDTCNFLKGCAAGEIKLWQQIVELKQDSKVSDRVRKRLSVGCLQGLRVVMHPLDAVHKDPQDEEARAVAITTMLKDFQTPCGSKSVQVLSSRSSRGIVSSCLC